MEDARGGATRRLIAIGGGIAFVGSLLFFVVSYGWRFDALPEPSVGAAESMVVDLGLFTLFALHHSVFARSRLKHWIRSVAGSELERSVYVWIASALFVVTCAYWRPVPGLAWRVTGAAGVVLQLGQCAGVAMSVLSARRLDTLDLAGVRQVLAPASGPQALDTRGPYAFVRHPIYFGWCLMVWLAPEMSGTRFVFAAVSTFYLVVAIPFEERELTRSFPSAYDEYRRRVRWRMIPYLY
jgi:protein-S-isoprenylcysteine O-methyltransferase Ste14